jgi:hypothetical protein
MFLAWVREQWLCMGKRSWIAGFVFLGWVRVRGDVIQESGCHVMGLCFLVRVCAARHARKRSQITTVNACNSQH